MDREVFAQSFEEEFNAFISTRRTTVVIEEARYKAAQTRWGEIWDQLIDQISPEAVQLMHELDHLISELEDYESEAIYKRGWRDAIAFERILGGGV